MQNQLKLIVGSSIIASLLLSGCSSIGGTVADVGLAGLGGVAGYKLTDGKVGGAAIGAATGFIASKVVQSQVESALSEAEKRGYDRAMNQAVKQQYWMIQNQQRPSELPAARFLPVLVPAQAINGVITNPTTEYVRVQS